jgi:hypothetical protein
LRQLISVPDSGGPDAWDASDDEGRSTGTRTITPLTRFQTSACGLRAPNGSPPLNTLLPRPSQKLRKLNTALITDGELRGSTRLVFTPPILKPSPPWPITSSAT